MRKRAETAIGRSQRPSNAAAINGDGTGSRSRVEDLIFGEGLRTVIERIEQVAPTDVPVLVQGETGSGKELVAQHLHARSRRANAPLIRVNCGAIPSEMVDSELFGHERGSFTGAVGTRQGWFERADGGTLFLDEVAELDAEAQVRLLRVLEDGRFARVGGAESIAVSVRVVTATHRDLGAMCAAGTFRSDLWYRLAVFTIRIPPLRERPQDIPELARHFAERAGRRLWSTPLEPTHADLGVLLAHHWPGNVRELAAVVERAAILGDGHRLAIVESLGDHPDPRELPPAPRPVAERFVTLDDAMREHIRRALVVSEGRVEGARGAAALLRLNPSTLRGKMRKLGIAGPYRRQ